MREYAVKCTRKLALTLDRPIGEFVYLDEAQMIIPLTVAKILVNAGSSDTTSQLRNQRTNLEEFRIVCPSSRLLEE